MDPMSVCDDLFGHTYQMRGYGGPESVLSGHSKKEDQKLVFKSDYSKMLVKSIAECSWSILQILSTFIKLPFVIKTAFIVYVYRGNQPLPMATFFFRSNSLTLSKLT